MSLNNRLSKLENKHKPNDTIKFVLIVPSDTDDREVPDSDIEFILTWDGMPEDPHAEAWDHVTQ